MCSLLLRGKGIVGAGPSVAGNLSTMGVAAGDGSSGRSGGIINIYHYISITIVITTLTGVK